MKRKKIKLDAFEQSIENNAEKMVSASPETRAKFAKIISNAKKDRSVNLRFNSNDLELVKQKAEESGLPYQTLISMIIHKYITDQLWDKNEVMKTLQLYRKR